MSLKKDCVQLELLARMLVDTLKLSSRDPARFDRIVDAVVIQAEEFLDSRPTHLPDH